MPDPPKVGGIEYRAVGKDYFKNRGLRRHAGVWSLWALGVGAVISGDFFGWNFGLLSGGFGGLLLATLIITVMYVGMCYSIAEMAAALPHTGGAYSFGRTAMGPWGGFMTGLAGTMEYVLTPAVIVVGIGGYLSAIFNDLFGVEVPHPLWWLIAYVIFVSLNIVGAAITFRFSLIITLLALTILAVAWVGSLPHFDLGMALNIEPEEGGTRWFPMGHRGVAYALPFAMWFYLAIEEVPLASEESHDPKRDMPKGILYGLITLIIAAFLTLFSNAGIAPGANLIGASDEPLFLVFKTIFGKGVEASLFALIAVTGLIASFHSIIYAYGRNIYSLSRGGYFPRWLSVTHGERKTPYVALITGAVLGYCMALLIYYSPQDSPVGAVLLNMAVFGALIAYILQMASFVLLRKNLPEMDRPFVSRLGNAGAVGALTIAGVTLVLLFLNPDYSVGVYGCALWFLAGIGYFAFRGRKNLVLAPEEEFAVRRERGKAQD